MAYLDVSGSFLNRLPVVGAALAVPHRRGEVRLFVFSTVKSVARHIEQLPKV